MGRFGQDNRVLQRREERRRVERLPVERNSVDLFAKRHESIVSCVPGCAASHQERHDVAALAEVTYHARTVATRDILAVHLAGERVARAARERGRELKPPGTRQRDCHGAGAAGRWRNAAKKPARVEIPRVGASCLDGEAFRLSRRNIRLERLSQVGVEYSHRHGRPGLGALGIRPVGGHLDGHSLRRLVSVARFKRVQHERLPGTVARPRAPATASPPRRRRP